MPRAISGATSPRWPSSARSAPRYALENGPQDHPTVAPPGDSGRGGERRRDRQRSARRRRAVRDRIGNGRVQRRSWPTSVRSTKPRWPSAAADLDRPVLATTVPGRIGDSLRSSMDLLHQSIRENEELRASLARNEARFRKMADESPDIVWRFSRETHTALRLPEPVVRDAHRHACSCRRSRARRIRRRTRLRGPGPGGGRDRRPSRPLTVRRHLHETTTGPPPCSSCASPRLRAACRAPAETSPRSAPSRRALEHPGVSRHADGAGQPGAVPRPARPGPTPGRAGLGADRRAVPGPRRFQDRE